MIKDYFSSAHKGSVPLCLVPLCFIIFIILSCFSCKNNNAPYPYTFYSTDNYDKTAVENLAKYVKKNDTIAILKFLNENPTVSIDTKDKYFGSSLLMFAIFNGKCSQRDSPSVSTILQRKYTISYPKVIYQRVTFIVL